MKNKLKGVGIDTSQIDYKPESVYAQDYIFIDTTKNNGFCLIDFVVGRKVIIKVGSLWRAGEILWGLENDLGNLSEIDVLLIPAEELISGDLSMLGEIIDRYKIGSVGIDRPENLEHLRKATENIKSVILPSYVSLDICPLHFQKDMIDWCEEEGLEILGFNPFGGFINGASVIECFTIPYLLEFAARYSVVVFLSGRDIISASYNSEYLKGLIGEDSDDELYEMKSGVNRLSKPLPRFIHSALKTERGGVIPYDNPEYLATHSELLMGLEKIKEAQNLESAGKIETLVREIFDYLCLRLEEKKPGIYFSVFRPKMIADLRKALGPECEIKQAKIGDTTFLMGVTVFTSEKRYLWKDKRIGEDTYFIIYLGNDDRVKLEIL